MPCRTKKSSTCLHLMMHIFMVYGVDPLVEEAVNRRESPSWMMTPDEHICMGKGQINYIEVESGSEEEDEEIGAHADNDSKDETIYELERQ
jgi:hypothetical protein